MPLDQMREQLLPGLIDCLEQRCYRELDALAAEFWVLKNVKYTVDIPAAVSLPVAVGMGTAAVIIKNPVVSRRFWSK